MFFRAAVTLCSTVSALLSVCAAYSLKTLQYSLLTVAVCDMTDYIKPFRVIILYQLKDIWRHFQFSCSYTRIEFDSDALKPITSTIMIMYQQCLQ